MSVLTAFLIAFLVLIFAASLFIAIEIVFEISQRYYRRQRVIASVYLFIIFTLVIYFYVNTFLLKQGA